MIKLQGLYEVLLVDNDGFIREGSRSNVFFIKGQAVITPPAKMVLDGITRQKVISILDSSCCTFREEAVALSQLGQFDTVMLTGTSPKVLPISRIGDLNFSTTNKIYSEIKRRYDALIDNYITKV